MANIDPEWLSKLRAGAAKEVSPLPISAGQDRLTRLPIQVLQDLPNQPFRIYQENEPRWEQLRTSIRQNGIIEPLLVRPLEGERYQIVSGRNRCNAARSLGHLSVPVIIREMTDDEAIIQMTTTNLIRRDDLLLSEKAFAYRMRLEAMNRQGQRTDLTSSPLGTKLNRSSEVIAEETGDSRNQIHRYIRLTYLIPPLLELVDKGQLSVRPAVALSYLSAAEQELVHRFCFAEGHHPVTEAHAEQLRQWSEAGEELTESKLAELFTPQTSPKPLKKVSVPMKSIRRYFRADATEQEMQQTILKALAQYFEGKEV